MGLKQSAGLPEQAVVDRLVERVKLGDEVAFREMYDLYFSSVYYYCLKVLGSKEDAMDVTQEVFSHVYQDISSFKDNKKFLQWLNSIAFHRCMDMWRKRKQQLKLKGKLEEETETFTITNTKDFEIKEVNLVIQKTIDELSETQRSAIVLFYLQGLSLKEVALIQGVSTVAVKSILFKARKKILGKMKESGHSSVKDLLPLILFALLLEKGKTALSSGTVSHIFDGVSKVFATPTASAATIPTPTASTTQAVTIPTTTTGTSALGSIIGSTTVKVVASITILGGVTATYFGASHLVSTESNSVPTAPIASTQAVSEIAIGEIETLEDMIGQADAALLNEMVASTATSSVQQLAGLIQRHGMTQKVTGGNESEQYSLYILYKGGKRLSIGQRYIGQSGPVVTKYLFEDENTPEMEDVDLYGWLQ